jgi:hypothetical protein
VRRHSAECLERSSSPSRPAAIRPRGADGGEQVAVAAGLIEQRELVAGPGELARGMLLAR